MFDIGSKVMVVASNLQKGDTGPRKGSIGYVVYVLNHEHRISSSPSLSVIPISILFNRFGYENKNNRMEFKTVNSILPNTFLNAQANSVETTIKLVNDTTASKNVLKSVSATTSYPASIIVPMDNMDLLNNDVEFKHWLLAHILSEQHVEVIDTFRNKKKAQHVCYKAGLDINLIGILSDMCNSKSFRAEALQTLLKDKLKVITTIRILFQMYYMNNYARVDKQLNEGQYRLHKDDGSVRFSMLYNLLFSDLFRPGRFESYIPVIMEKMDNEGCQDVLRYVLKLKEELSSLARCAVDGVGVEVKKARKK